MLLFVFVATTIEWHRVWLGFGLALALVAIRLVTKVTVVAGFAYVSGASGARAR